MNQPQYRLAWPPFTKPMIGLMVVFAVLWLGSLEGAPLHDLRVNYLTVSLQTIGDNYAGWSFLTYAFFHQDFFGILFSGIAIWLFGGELAQRWSPARFWGMQLGAIVLGGLLCFGALVAFGSDLTIQGYQAASMSLVFSYCWLRWRTPQHFFFFEMTGRSMLLLFLGLGVVGAVLGYWPTLILDLAGIAVGFVASKGKLNLRDLRTRYRLWQARRKLSIVRTPEDDDRPPRKTADGQYIN